MFPLFPGEPSPGITVLREMSSQIPSLRVALTTKLAPKFPPGDQSLSNPFWEFVRSSSNVPNSQAQMTFTPGLGGTDGDMRINDSPGVSMGRTDLGKVDWGE